VLVAVAAVVVAVAIAHGPRLLDNLSVAHWEDELFFAHDRAEVPSLSGCLTARPMWPGLYRPLTTTCYYHLGGMLFDHRLEGYHLVNVVLYAANGVLLFLVASRFLGPRWAVLPAVVFVSRSAHAEVVTNTAEFQALFYVFWALLALVAWSHGVATGEGTGFGYDFSPTNIVTNLATYLFGWVNPLVWGDEIVLPDIVARAAGSTAGPIVVIAVIAVPVAVIVRNNRSDALSSGTLSTDALSAAAFGCVFFLAATAPFAVLDDRLFLRYGYFGHAGLSLAAGAGLMALGDYLRRRLPPTAGATPGPSRAGAPPEPPGRLTP
jgi:hypothetical protein